MLQGAAMYDKMMLHYARLWPIGICPIAPGTCASFVAIVLAPFIFMPLAVSWRMIMLGSLYFTGVRAADRAEEMLGQKDPKSVVIDELFGQWLVLLPFMDLAYWEYGVAFVLFRFFDIVKPWPIKIAEKVPGGTGVMIDDAAAALYAMICMAVVRWVAYGGFF